MSPSTQVNPEFLPTAENKAGVQLAIHRQDACEDAASAEGTLRAAPTAPLDLPSASRLSSALTRTQSLRLRVEELRTDPLLVIKKPDSRRCWKQRCTPRSPHPSQNFWRAAPEPVPSKPTPDRTSAAVSLEIDLEPSHPSDMFDFRPKPGTLAPWE